MSLQPTRLEDRDSREPGSSAGARRRSPFRIFLYFSLVVSLALLAFRFTGFSPYTWVEKFLRSPGNSFGEHSIIRYDGRALDLFSYLESVKVYTTRTGAAASLADGPEAWRESHRIGFLYELTPRAGEEVFAGFAMKVRPDLIIDLAGFRALKIRFSPHAAGPVPDRVKLDIKSDGRIMRNITVKDINKKNGLIEVPLRFPASLPLSDISFTVKLEFVSRTEGGRGGFKVESVTLDE